MRDQIRWGESEVTGEKSVRGSGRRTARQGGAGVRKYWETTSHSSSMILASDPAVLGWRDRWAAGLVKNLQISNTVAAHLQDWKACASLQTK